MGEKETQTLKVVWEKNCVHKFSQRAEREAKFFGFEKVCVPTIGLPQILKFPTYE